MKNFCSMLLIAAALSGTAGLANAAVCTGPGQGNNVLYGEIPEASQCSGMFTGNTPNSTITVFGSDWDFLAKQPDGDGPFPDALSFTVDPNSGGLSGTWSIDLSALGGAYNSFVIALKPDGGFGYFLVENALSGTWSTDSSLIPGGCPPGGNCAGFALSHISLYGQLDGRFLVPEPGTLGLLGIGILGLALPRRRSKLA